MIVGAHCTDFSPCRGGWQPPRPARRRGRAEDTKGRTPALAANGAHSQWDRKRGRRRSEQVEQGKCPESGGGECLMGEGEIPSVSMEGGLLNGALKYVEGLFLVRWKEKAKVFQPTPKKAA